LKSKTTLLFLGLVFFTASIKAQKISLTETKTNSTIKKYNSILIIGGGSTASRLFLDNLSEKLIAILLTKNITCEYKYIGNIERGEQITDLPIFDNKHDGYLLFNPTDTSIMKITTSTNGGSIFSNDINNAPGGHLYSRKVSYEETFDISFYDNENKKTSIWEAELTVNADFSKARLYTKTSEKIKISLQQNLIIPKK
jgi:hypothetical protein